MSNIPDNFGVIPANTRLQIAISTNIENPANVSILQYFRVKDKDNTRYPFAAIHRNRNQYEQ